MIVLLLLLNVHEPFAFTEIRDLLPPSSQDEPPEFSSRPDKFRPAGAHHRLDDCLSVAGEDTFPKYMQLRVRLVFGQAPTPSTTQCYWFAIMPNWWVPANCSCVRGPSA